MTVKLLLLKSGEDIICDLQEMAIGEETEKKVIGYFLKNPCVVKIVDDFNKEDDTLRITLYPWMPLSSDEIIPIPSDWVVTIVEPIPQLKQMYVKDVINHGNEDDQDSSTDESTTTDQ